MRKYLRALGGQISRLFPKIIRKKRICPICGNVNPPQSAFCDFCGSPLEPAVVPSIETQVPDIVVGFVSDVGSPQKNEDSLVVLETSSMYGVRPNKRVLSVAVRGVEKIVQAKEIVKRLCPNLLLKEDNEQNFYKKLSKFQVEAFSTISSEIGSKPEAWAKIGLLTSIIDGNRLIVSSIGKMRVYIISEEEIAQIAGFVPGEDLHAQALRLHRVQLDEGDRILMCYDDLADLVSEKEIRDKVLQAEIPQKACEELMKMAKEQGMESGFSAVIARII